MNSKNNYFFIAILSLILSCQTQKKFEIETTPRSGKFSELHVIKIKSDRVKQECYFLNAEAENNWRHQYFMYLLNEKNEAFILMQPTNQDDEQCNNQLKKISQILKSQSYVQICARNDLKLENEIVHYSDFADLGRHRVVYSQLHLDSICNSKECFSNNATWLNTCPGFTKNSSNED